MTGGTELIRGMATGDRDAFALFYDRYAPIVYPVILRIVRDAPDVADVIQEVFWESWQNAAAYDPARGSAEAWLLTRAGTRAIDHVRAVRRRGETFVAPGDEVTAAAPAAPRCEAAVRETDELLARAAVGGPPMAPPAELRAMLVRRVAASRRPAPLRWQRWAIGTAAAAVAAAVLSGVYVSARYEARLGEMVREQGRVKEALARSETVLREQAAFYRGAMELLRDPATRVVELRGQPAAPTAVARIVWQDASGGLLFAANLPPAPAGKAYELWTIAGAAPRAAGVFAPDALGRATLAVPAAPPAPPGTPVQVFAVTLEPEGGVDAPTGPMILASK